MPNSATFDQKSSPPTREEEQVEGYLSSAMGAKKCHRCGCFQDAIAALEETPLSSPLAVILRRGREAFEERRYDCLGCEVCWPADALNAAAEVVELPDNAGCPTDPPELREGWPPYAGEYRMLRFAASVAVCTLCTRGLVDELARIEPEGLSVVGSLQTENLGIERIIENIVTNPHIRMLLLCGEDTIGRVGHKPGQSLIALADNGTDEEGRIIGAKGKRPILRNLSADVVEHFRRVVQIIDHRGLVDAAVIAERVIEAAASAPGPVENAPAARRSVRVLRATQPDRLILDPAGYVVIVLDRKRRLLVVEHYENQGVLRTVVEGEDPVMMMATLLQQGLVTRLDHAAYLGRELTLARHALDEGSPYIQDRAPESSEPSPSVPKPTSSSCGCGSR